MSPSVATIGDDDPVQVNARSRVASEVRGQVGLALHLLRWIALGAVSGVLAGLSSFVFLEGLDRVTEYRVEHDWLLYLLPVAGLAIGAAYHYFGGRSAEGNSLLLDEIHEPTAWVPRRMAPLVLAGTWVTHLFGGSAGREGTALQMSGSLSDGAARALRLAPDDRRIMLVTALGGGFGAVFGVPLAGAVFALEVQSIGRMRYEALVPALTASLIGDLVVHGLGHDHPLRPQFETGIDGWLWARVAIAGLLFGLAGAAFIELTHFVKRLAARWMAWPPLRPFAGGVAVIGLALAFGDDYLGLSLPLIDRALAGESLSFGVFALKIVFTAVTLGCAFPGGEVTPLFVIGATLGAALAGPLSLPVSLVAAVGFVAVFAGAANTPLACTIMGVELFGAGAMLPIAIGCVVAYVFSNHRGIYPGQRLHTSKGPLIVTGDPRLSDWRPPH
jgi:H+/Cl- antiporter ClcA